MRCVAAAGVALLICACSTGGTAPVSREPSPLTRGGAEQLVLRADDIMRAVLAGSRTATLADAFRGRALQALEAQSEGMAGRGLRLEERRSARTLVYWDPRAGEAVLQVAAQSRLVTPDQPNPAWAGTLRQWWARVQYSEGGWWVVDEEDLTPDRWRAPPTHG